MTRTRTPFKSGHVALERALSKLGIASRTEARKWILEGRVTVNGSIRRQPHFAVRPETARIEIDGTVRGGRTVRNFLLYKPKGTVTTRSDEHGRPTVFSLLPIEGLHAVGRLDLATTGLLILTNNTRLSAWLTDPIHGVPRVYVVTVRGEVGEDELRKLRAGIEDSGDILSPGAVDLRKSSGRESHLTITLREGKNREIRRMFGGLGHEVTRLKRVEYGGLTLGNLKPGEYRELKTAELQEAFPELPATFFDR